MRRSLAMQVAVLALGLRTSSKTKMICNEMQRLIVGYQPVEATMNNIQFIDDTINIPPSKKIPFKQAPRQSFRQSMRSVNRNR